MGKFRPAGQRYKPSSPTPDSISCPPCPQTRASEDGSRLFLEIHIWSTSSGFCRCWASLLDYRMETSSAMRSSFWAVRLLCIFGLVKDITVFRSVVWFRLFINENTSCLDKFTRVLPVKENVLVYWQYTACILYLVLTRITWPFSTRDSVNSGVIGCNRV